MVTWGLRTDTDRHTRMKTLPFRNFFGGRQQVKYLFYYCIVKSFERYLDFKMLVGLSNEADKKRCFSLFFGNWLEITSEADISQRRLWSKIILDCLHKQKETSAPHTPTRNKIQKIQLVRSIIGLTWIVVSRNKSFANQTSWINLCFTRRHMRLKVFEHEKVKRSNHEM